MCPKQNLSKASNLDKVRSSKIKVRKLDKVRMLRMFSIMATFL